MVPIVQELMKELLVSEKTGDTTEKTCSRLALKMLEAYCARVDLELESEATTLTSLDLGGDVKALSSYRSAIKKARARVERWRKCQEKAIAEAM